MPESFAYNSFQMFFETLYRVDPRGKTFLPGDNASLSETEYFQPQFELEFREGKHVFFIREKHATSMTNKIGRPVSSPR